MLRIKLCSPRVEMIIRAIGTPACRCSYARIARLSASTVLPSAQE